jgi:hypothetical protein
LSVRLIAATIVSGFPSRMGRRINAAMSDRTSGENIQSSAVSTLAWVRRAPSPCFLELAIHVGSHRREFFVGDQARSTSGTR